MSAKTPWIDFGKVYGWDELNPVQVEAADLLRLGSDVVIAANSGAGKTAVAEMAIARALAGGGRAVYVSPLKALTQEKHDAWRAPAHPFAAAGVGQITGDHRTDAADLDGRRVVCCTSEMLDSRGRGEMPRWLGEANVLVVDEVHLLGAEKRGPALEAGLMNFLSARPACAVVALSATAPNVGGLAAWLGKLVGRPVAHMTSDWRPVPLRFHVKERAGMGRSEDRALAAVELIEENDLRADGQVLVFTHTKADGRAFRKEWARGDRGECPFFHAGLRAEERGRLARRFASGDVEVMATTSSLSMGINLPARHVVLVGVKRGPTVLTGTEILQSAGRAGRKGLDEHGDAWILTHDASKVRLEPEPVLSKLGQRLEFHLVAEIDRGRVKTGDDSGRWLNKTLWVHQSPDKVAYNCHEIRMDAMDDLVEIGALERMGKHYRVTRIGRCASRFYLDPRSVAGWRRNFLRLRDARAMGSDPELACAIADVEDYSSKRWGNYAALKRADGALFDETDPAWVPGSPGAREAAWAAYLCLSGGSDRDIGPILSGLRADARRLCAAWAMLMRGAGVPERYWWLLERRLLYGVPWSIAGLTRLAGIGRMRALALVDEGIESVRDFLRQRDVAREVVGERVWRQAVASAAGLKAEGKI